MSTKLGWTVKTAQRHSRALNGPGQRTTSWPLSKAEWVRWLDQEQGTYENVLRSVKVGVRRTVNVRVTPHPDVPQTGCSDPPKATYWYMPPGLGTPALQRVARAAHEGHRRPLCHFVARCAGESVAFTQALVVVHSDGIRRQ